MKVTALFAVGVFVSFGAAQDLSSLSECGRTCIQDMLSLAPSLGCKADDIPCLCQNTNFGNGVRDCTVEACGEQDLPPILEFAKKFCSGGSPSGSPDATETIDAERTASSTGSLKTTTGENRASTATGSSIAKSYPYTTQAVVSTITSGTQVITITDGITTLYSSVSETPRTTDTTSQPTGSTSPTEEPKTTSSSETTGANQSISSNASPSSTRSNNGALPTLAPANPGVIGALGVIAVLVL
ncbi:hypothetical protein ACO22_06665 [Paracoccidioides brasiliensis]|nr:hypothetical protein ACO22_06665 [Paracoccidioides brasiliensis]